MSRLLKMRTAMTSAMNLVVATEEEGEETQRADEHEHVEPAALLIEVSSKWTLRVPVARAI